MEGLQIQTSKLQMGQSFLFSKLISGILRLISGRFKASSYRFVDAQEELLATDEGK